MNEELMKQLVEILKQLKDGTPGAWQELVHQRQLYCFSSGGGMFVLGLIFIIITFYLLKKCKLSYKNDPSDDIYVGFTFGLVISAIISLGCFIVGFEHIVNGIAPLGQVLSKLN